MSRLKSGLALQHQRTLEQRWSKAVEYISPSGKRRQASTAPFDQGHVFQHVWRPQDVRRQHLFRTEKSLASLQRVPSPNKRRSRTSENGRRIVLRQSLDTSTMRSHSRSVAIQVD